MFIVHKAGLVLNGESPTILYGYGGFNVSLDPAFNATNWPWYEGGGVYAIANLRGGSEYGEDWHKAGMRANKQNVFDDFYACAEWLISSKFTNSKHLAIQGGSNGGLLTGVAVTQRPDLFCAAISAVPLLDMIRYHQFLIAKFWVPEYGSSEDVEQFGWIRKYSPYQHVTKGTKYPAVLFTAGENDSRVHPLHARKMAARMQALSANDDASDPILLWVDRNAGHGQGKPLANRIAEQADQWAFMMWQTGMCR
jgi:prolyl oligopeptidase